LDFTLLFESLQRSIEALRQVGVNRLVLEKGLALANGDGYRDTVGNYRGLKQRRFELLEDTKII